MFLPTQESGHFNQIDVFIKKPWSTYDYAPLKNYNSCYRLEVIEREIRLTNHSLIKRENPSEYFYLFLFKWLSFFTFI